MRQQIRLLLFITAAILQLATPLYMAWHWEDILQTGETFYWQTAPVDPYDTFKGRYMDLRFQQTTIPRPDHTAWRYGQTAYALIDHDSQNHAYISGISRSAPSNAAYLQVKVSYIQDDTIHIELPFKRYYLPEDLTTAAENAYRKHVGDATVAAVRIKDGYGVIEQLYIKGQPLSEFLQNQK